MIKKIAKKITQICVALALMIVPVISTTWAGNSVKVYANTHNSIDSQDVIVLNNGSDSEIDEDGADDFASALAPALSASGSYYEDIEAELTQAGTSVASSNIYVKFGGITWLVTYLSLNTDGDAIATLWMADYDSNITSTWSSGWYADNPGDAYPSNMYGASYIRTVLNGGYYVEAYSDSVGGTLLTDYSASTYGNLVDIVEGTQNNLFKPFTGTYNGVNLTRYITTPAKVSWQQYGQRMHTIWSYDENDPTEIDPDCPNENWGTITNSNDTDDYWYLGPQGQLGLKALDPTSNEEYYVFLFGDHEAQDVANLVNLNNYNYSGKEITSDVTNYNIGNNVWKNDYLWLPSLYETGYSNNDYTGLWDLTNAQRAWGPENTNSNDYYSWLRSGNSYYANYA